MIDLAKRLRAYAEHEQFPMFSVIEEYMNDAADEIESTGGGSRE